MKTKKETRKATPKSAPKTNLANARSVASPAAIERLKERAMLMTVSVSCWTAARQDKEISDEVADKHGAQRDMGAYRKYLIERKALQPISQKAGAARAAHYERTLPWGDDGYRMLPARGFTEHQNVLRTLKDEYWEAYRQFKADYPQLVMDAKKALNGLFRLEDYPDYQLLDLSNPKRPRWIPGTVPADLDSRFAFSVTPMPIPDAADFRVDIGEDELEAVRAACATDSQARLHAAVADVWTRFHEVVAAMVERLHAYGKPKPGWPKTKSGAQPVQFFLDTLVSNVTDLLELVPVLNVTDDPAITAIAAEMRAKLTVTPPETLRRDPKIRSKVAADAQAIVDKMASFLA